MKNETDNDQLQKLKSVAGRPFDRAKLAELIKEKAEAIAAEFGKTNSKVFELEKERRRLERQLTQATRAFEKMEAIQLELSSLHRRSHQKRIMAQHERAAK